VKFSGWKTTERTTRKVFGHSELLILIDTYEVSFECVEMRE